MVGSSRKVRNTYLQMVQNFQLIGRLPKLTRMDELVISFIEEDAKQLHHPHDNALVINLTIVDFNTQQVLVDNEISADILYYPTFQQMRIGRKRLMSVRSITLPVTINTYPQQITKNVTFFVMDCSSAYNSIIR